MKTATTLAACGLGVASLLALTRAPPAAPPATPPHSTLVFPGPNGTLVYKPHNDRGDTIPDFSHCGYGGGGVALPDVPVATMLRPQPGDGDDRPRIQAAMDALARKTPDAHGFRGAVLLARGRYRVDGPLRIAQSGIVLRGEGAGENGTTLAATARRPYTLIEVRGSGGVVAAPEKSVRITDAYVPVGAQRFTVAAGHGLKPGDTVLVRREGNAAWIHEIGMDRITPRASDPGSTQQWKPFALDFDRVVTAVEGNKITLDAPIACAIEARWGGGSVVPYTDAGRIEQVGVENLWAESLFDQSRTAKLRDETYFSDENHAEYLVRFDNVKNAWAKNVTTVHMAHGIVNFGRGAKWVTVEDGDALDPVSAITGGRRYPYHIAGQLLLVQRCHARGARHAFVFNSRVPGPNVFLDCRADNNYATSEPHHRWSVGGLYDNVRADMAIQDRQWMGSGHGWAGANYVVWNSSGSLVCQQPPTAQNFAIGFVGKRAKGAFARPDGWWESQGTHVVPSSLYRQQLADRIGR